MSEAPATGRHPRVLSLDAGGTLTDAFLVDRDGRFVVGKAQTTPEDESIGFMRSVRDGLRYWDTRPEEAFPSVVSCVYSGTAMLNRLLSRTGQRLGVLVTAGFEDALLLERGLQTYLGYSYSDRLHVVTHRHNEPLVPRERVFGVRGRIDIFGEEQIPVYAEEARAAVRALLAMEVDAICVSLLFSFANPAHERRVAEVAREAMAEAGREAPLFLASELYPVEGDFARLNTLLVEAYAAEPSRGQMQRVQGAIAELGSPAELRVMASHGGTISADALELARTLVSGPIGGVVGARHLARELGFGNVVCSDIGGTSFDLALITDGEFSIRTQVDLARFVLKLPSVQIDSVGSGTGSFVRLTPRTRRVEIGPDSAGYRIGVANRASGLETPTITDCDLVLGWLNPDYFLGGDIQLDVEHALASIHAQLAGPLGLDPYEAAEGVVTLFQDNLRNELNSRILGKGYAPESFRLLSYGGGGPVHVAGYTQGLRFDDILVPSWAAGFSAFGCACAEYEYRADKSIRADVLGPGFAADVNDAWAELEQRVRAEFAKSGVAAGDVQLRHVLRVQYQGQLNDLEIVLPFERVGGEADAREVIERFESAYATMYSRSARSPELGYQATRAIVTGVVEIEKPVLPVEPLGSAEPPAAARRGTRRVYVDGGWTDATILAMERLEPGNAIRGFAVVESPSTTFVIPTGREARLDEHRIFHLSN